MISGTVADQVIAQIVACAVDGRCPGQFQAIDVGAKHVANAGKDLVSAFATVLRDRIANIVDVVDIVPEATGHCVGTDAAVQRIVACSAIQDIVSAIAEHGVVTIAAFEQIVLTGANEIIVSAIPLNKIKRILDRQSCYLNHHRRIEQSPGELQEFYVGKRIGTARTNKVRHDQPAILIALNLVIGLVAGK